jgi:murein DD-endopeptidase MepM/ murein hydrolase activator NlpD
MRPFLPNPRLVVLVAVVVASGCQPEIVPEPYVPTSAHDAYRHALVEAGLTETALGRDWRKAGEAALRSPVEIAAPFRETVYVDPTQAFAAGYRFSVVRGQRTEIQLTIEPASDWRIYLDLFREPDEPGQAPVHVASGGEGDLRLAFEPRRDGDYLLRLHSELLRGGSCTFEIRNVASLEFPVAGHDTSAIGSTFGAPREAGRRSHHGVDIFARRHTEVLATSDARVRRVDEWKLGGNVIWLEDPERNIRLYFAHLQTQDVEEGVWVQAGDRIGTVGNSGNARTTPPHLHFGVYVRGEGPIDPYPFLHQPRREPRPVRVTLENLGTWVRTKDDRVSLRPRPGADPPLGEVPRHTPVFVSAGASRSYRVTLPNGLAGYVAESETEPLTDSIDAMELARETHVLDRPATDAAVMRRVGAGDTVDVLARFGNYAWVDVDLPRPAWIRTADSSATATAP